MMCTGHDVHRGCRTRGSAVGGHGAHGTGGNHGHHKKADKLACAHDIRLPWARLSPWALVFLLLLLPRLAYAAPSLEVDGNFAGYEDGEEYKGYVVVNSPDNYQSTLCLIGEWSKLPQITTEQYGTLSHPSTGGAFYELSQLWKKLGRNASGTEEYYPQWLALSEDFADGLVTVYGYGKVWAAVCTDELIEQAKTDFNTIIGGGSVGDDEPESPTYSEGYFEYVSDSNIILHLAPNYRNGATKFTWAGTTYVLYNNETLYNASTSADKHYIENINLNIVSTSTSWKFENINTYYGLAGSFSKYFYQSDGGITTVEGDGYISHIRLNSTNGPVYYYYNMNITGVEIDGNIMNISAACYSKRSASTSGENQYGDARYAVYGTNGGSSGGGTTPEPDPEPSPDPWEPPTPSPDPPTNPTTPTPKDPITPDPPSLPGPPSNPTNPTPPSSPTLPTDTTHTADLQGLLDALSEHCIHIQTCLNSNFSGQNSYLGELFSTYTAAIVDQIYNGDQTKIEAINDVNNTIAQGFNDIFEYWDEYVNWLDDKLDFKWPEVDEYDDTDLLSWLKRIWARQGTGDVNTRPVDPATNYPGFAQWFGQLAGKLSADVSDTSLSSLSTTLGTLQHTFPFSLPWDIQQILSSLDASPVTPSGSITIPAVQGWWQSYSYDIDLHWLDSAMVPIRAFELLMFVLYCLVHTKDVFGYVVGD